MKSAPLVSARSVCVAESGDVKEVQPANIPVDAPLVDVVSIAPIEVIPEQPLNIFTKSVPDSVAKLPNDVKPLHP